VRATFELSTTERQLRSLPQRSAAAIKTRPTLARRNASSTTIAWTTASRGFSIAGRTKTWSRPTTRPALSATSSEWSGVDNTSRTRCAVSSAVSS